MRKNLNDLMKKLHSRSGLSFVKLSKGCGVSSQALHNWASGSATQTPDVRMLSLLLSTFSAEDVASAIKASAAELLRK